MREAKLMWFGQIKMDFNVPVRRCEMINVTRYKRGKGRLKKSWNWMNEIDIHKTHLCLLGDKGLDMGFRRSRIIVINSRYHAFSSKL